MVTKPDDMAEGGSWTPLVGIVVLLLLRALSVLGVPSFLEVTVEADEHMDLSEYDCGTMHRKQCAIFNKGVEAVNEEDKAMRTERRTAETTT